MFFSFQEEARADTKVPIEPSMVLPSVGEASTMRSKFLFSLLSLQVVGCPASSLWGQGRQRDSERVLPACASPGCCVHPGGDRLAPSGVKGSTTLYACCSFAVGVLFLPCPNWNVFSDLPSRVNLFWSAVFPRLEGKHDNLRAPLATMPAKGGCSTCLVKTDGSNEPRTRANME